MGRLIPLTRSVTDPLSMVGGSDSPGESGAGDSPPRRPFAAEGVSWPPGPRRSCCDDALPPPEPSSVSTYTPAPIPASTATAAATAMPVRNRRRRADGGWTGYPG